MIEKGNLEERRAPMGASPVNEHLRRAIVARFDEARRGKIITVVAGNLPGEVIFITAEGAITCSFLDDGESIIMQKPTGSKMKFPRIQFLADVAYGQVSH